MVFKKITTSLNFKVGSAKDDQTKAVTPMIYYAKFEATDGVVVNIGIGWWHWYAKVQVGYLY